MHLDARSKQSANTAVLAQLCTWGHFKGFKDPNSGISLLTTEGRSRGAVMDEGLLLCWFSDMHLTLSVGQYKYIWSELAAPYACNKFLRARVGD